MIPSLFAASLSEIVFVCIWFSLLTVFIWNQAFYFLYILPTPILSFPTSILMHVVLLLLWICIVYNKTIANIAMQIWLLAVLCSLSNNHDPHCNKFLGMKIYLKSSTLWDYIFIFKPLRCKSWYKLHRDSAFYVFDIATKQL